MVSEDSQFSTRNEVQLNGDTVWDWVVPGTRAITTVVGLVESSCCSLTQSSSAPQPFCSLPHTSETGERIGKKAKTHGLR